MTTNLFKKYESDPKKELTGVEINIEDNIFICRRAGGGNRAYRVRVGQLALARREVLNSTDLEVSTEAEDEVTMEAFSTSVVVGWRDVLGRDGQPLPFSPENFIDLMKSCPDVWLLLRVEARDIEKFRVEEIDEIGTALGN